MTASLPTGTVTFLFTDIEGSTCLWQDQPQAMASAHARHNAILRAAIDAHHGFVFNIVGDSFSAAFHRAEDGLGAAVMAQQGLHTEAWGATGALRVRMGLHTGAARVFQEGTRTDYEGYTLSN